MKSDNSFLILAYFLLRIISYSLLVAPAWAQDYKGAACVIFVNDKIVLVRDSLSNRLSFPGGYINRKERPEQAAQRETYEETGLRVTVGPQIESADQSAQFICRSDTPIPILSTQGFESRPIVYALPAPDFSVEIRQVYLDSPQSVKAESLRFPNQIKLLSDFNRYPEWQSSIILLTKYALPINNLYKIELKIIAQLQNQLAPQADLLFRILNLVGENVVFFILVPIIWAYSGWQTGVRCVLLLITAAESSNILKIIFALPRPFHLMPELQRMEAYGFGMPSGHVLVGTAFWGYCWHSFKRLLPQQKQRTGFYLLITVLTGCGIARVYWGVHFVSDVFVGATFGLLLLNLFIRLEEQGLWHQMTSARKTPWGVGFVIIAIAAFYTPGLLSSYMGGLAMGIFLGLCIGKTQALHEKVAINKKLKSSIAGLGIVGIMLLDRTGKLLVSQQANSIIAMLIYFACYLLIGLWLTIGMYLLPLACNRPKPSP
ncbi:phosphatase PAP2 family protein [Methyloglobulus sp.]|uniref:phosphatase PAP2 family protein n=1 Tax=Methyloglobulus sp. TaxID=2518622 RepID=UPI0032B80569